MISNYVSVDGIHNPITLHNAQPFKVMMNGDTEVTALALLIHNDVEYVVLDIKGTYTLGIAVHCMGTIYLIPSATPYTWTTYDDGSYSDDLPKGNRVFMMGTRDEILEYLRHNEDDTDIG